MSTLLNQVYESGQSIDLKSLKDASKRNLVRAIQAKLCELGVLDPIISGDRHTPFRPISTDDGAAGPETINAIVAFQKWINIPKSERSHLVPAFFQLLSKHTADTLFPIRFHTEEGDSIQVVLAKRLLRYMKKKGHWIARSPDMFNIIYIEGVDKEGRPNKDIFDLWNDRRCIIRILPDGTPEMLVNDLATTEPGKFYTFNPSKPQGVARIAFGQYKAWRFGYHKGVQPALVQRANVRLHRDMNKNFVRDKLDFMDVGYSFGINQHSTRLNLTPNRVNRFSAGCLVGHRYNYHLSFLYIIGHDHRYINNPNYLFMTTVINGDDLMHEEPFNPSV